MYKHWTLFLAWSLVICSGAAAQGPCSTASTKVACTIPQVYGPQGLQYTSSPISPNPLTGTLTTQGVTLGDVTQNLSPFNTGVASQFALIPLVSPAPGLTLTFDKTLGVFVASDDSFGPTLSERASTIGKHRLAIGFNYEYLHFDSIDGINLNHFQTVDLHGDIPGDGHLLGSGCSINGTDPGPQNTGGCGIVRDYILAQNSIKLRMNQYTAFVTFGLTSRIDISAAIPVLDVSLTMTSNATVVQNSKSNGTVFLNPSIKNSEGDPACLFDSAANGEAGHVPVGCLNETFSKRNQASGLGDITLRGKATVWKGERTGIALGLDVRLPTGDELNFLGSGAYGFKPFAIWSYDGRISPHVNVGYERNSSSRIAGDLTTGTKGEIPNQFLYSVGADMALTRRLTGAVDLIGQRVFDATRITLAPVTVLGACDGPALTDRAISGTLCTTAGPKVPGLTSAAVTSGSYSINNALLGLRYRPFGKLLVSASVLLKLDNGGLRAKAIPLVSATYTIH